MESVYIDSLFLLNLAVDYLLLLATGRICSCRLRRAFILLGAALGAAYAALLVFPWAQPLARFPVKLLVGCGMVETAYFSEKNAPRRWAVFLAVSAAFGGAVYAVSLLGGGPALSGRGLYIPVSMRVLLLSFAVCYAVLSLVFRRAADRTGRQTLAVCASFRGKTAAFTALRDTGNALYDPLSGAAVCIVETRALLPLFEPEEQALLSLSDPLELVSKLREKGCAFRLLPYAALGNEHGLLPVFRPERVTVNGREAPGLLLAVSPAALCRDGEFSAIL